MERLDQDFLQELGYLGFTMRIKRLSDKLMQEGRRLYQGLDLEIEPNWYGVLLLLESHKRLTLTDLAKQLKLSHPSAIAIVNKMDKAGFITTAKDEDDARKRQLVLTDKAVERLPGYKRVWSAGTEAVNQLLAGTNLFAELSTLEEHLNEGGFDVRTTNTFAEYPSMEDSLQIVPFAEEYAADFGRINYEWLHMYFKVEPHDYEILDAPKSYVVDRGGQIFFALCGGAVAGTVAMIKQGEGIYELSKMGVTPMYKGYGIGKALMEAAISYAKEQNATKVYLDSNSRLGPALGLYRSMGFKDVALDPNTPYERCDVRMDLYL